MSSRQQPVETERDWQRTVMALLRLHGWRVYHTWLSIRSAPGFPDIIAVRDRRLVAIELKSARGALSDEQREWLEALAAAGVETHVWRPSDWETAKRVVSR